MIKKQSIVLTLSVIGVLAILLSNVSEASTENAGESTPKSPTPVVFWHGMGDTAYGSIDINRIVLEKKFPGIHIMSIQIGMNPIRDALSGYLINVNNQIEEACQQVLNDTTIRQYGSFNAIGFSQGGQFLRGLIQRCPLQANNVRVKNLITLGGQHQGVYGLPRCPTSSSLCDYVRHLLNTAAYEDHVQDHVVQAEYWHDPTQRSNYITKSVFLADINNERQVNTTYKQNLLQLDNMVLVKFEQDDIVVPRETSVSFLLIIIYSINNLFLILCSQVAMSLL